MVNSFPNTYGISKITLTRKIHCYCRLGGYWYTNKLNISFVPQDEIPDYVAIDADILSTCEQNDMIIEEVVASVRDIIKKHCPSAVDLHISSYVDDSVPRDMQVLVELNE